jgi:hypothetical protein
LYWRAPFSNCQLWRKRVEFPTERRCVSST